jgi:hypothetical protein
MRFAGFACSLFVVAGLAACASPEECRALDVDLKAECGTVEACCTDVACRYVSSSGREWSCDGTECEGAAMELALECAQRRE